MPQTDNRIDEYINAAAPFAQPILLHIRQLVHHACPTAVETLKWGMPYFTYRNNNLCGMAAFKHHCVFVFWLGNALTDPHQLLQNNEGKNAMGHLGQIKSVHDLPIDEILIEYIREAMALNEQGVKNSVRKSAGNNEPLQVPDEIIKILQTAPMASEVFANLSPSHKKEYIEWITGAKTAVTKQKRLATMLEWLGEGKSLNWRYMKK